MMKPQYDNPRNIYLPKIYGNDNNLEELFEGIDVSFVHSCYIEQDIKQIDGEISELKNKLKGKSRRWKKRHRKEASKIERQIEKLNSERNEKIEEWKEFLLRIGVNEIPEEEYYDGLISFNDKYPTREEREYSTRVERVKDWRLSKEFNELLKRNEIDKIKMLVILDKLEV